MAKRDYYEVLEVTKTSTADEIKKAYRKMAIKYHPDKNQGDKAAEEKFKEAAEAYEVLSDPEKKAQYDRFGHQGMSGQGFGGGRGQNMEDIFSNFGDIFGDESPFGSFFGGGRQSGGGGRTQRGSNLRVKVKMKLEEIATGVEKKIKLKKQITCTTCSGSGAAAGSTPTTCGTCKGAGQVKRVTNTFLGQMMTTAPCPTCNGEGRIITNKCGVCHGDGRVMGEDTIAIQIPKGVTDGVQLSVSGRGNAAPKGGIPGDLIVVIEEEEHEHFEREGNDIELQLKLNFADAVLGTSVDVPTIDGKARIKIPEGTSPGKIFRLKGKGIPDLNGYGVGDQLVIINIQVPTKVSSEEKSMLEKMKSSDNFHPVASKEDKSFFEKVKNFFH